jgi:hypothetical protein
MPFDDDLEWLRAAIVEAGRLAGIEVERADDIFEPGVVIDQIRDRIEIADAVIAVCTGRNANVFYELGIADVLGHRAVLIAESSADLPFDVQHFRAHLYGAGTPDRTEFVVSRVAGALRDLAAAGGRQQARSTQAAKSLRPHLRADLYKTDRTYTLEILNDGDIPLSEVEWDFPADARNWHRVDVLPKYPVSSIEPGESVRVPVIISIGGPAGIELGLRAQLEDGTPYTRSQVITAY